MLLPVLAYFLVLPIQALELQIELKTEWEKKTVTLYISHFPFIGDSYSYSYSSLVRLTSELKSKSL
jgi:hypothetical protein